MLYFTIVVFLTIFLSSVGQEPHCEVLSNPENGRVIIVGKPIKVGSLAMYKCDKNYEIQGIKTLKCQSSRDWTFNPPKCVAPCSVPSVANGQIGKYQNGKEFRVLAPNTLLDDNEELLLRCDETYEPFGKNLREDRVTCSKGVWKEVPTCKIANCRSEPPKGPNHVIDAYESEHGKRAYYSCAGNAEKKSPGDVTCLFGKWTGKPPECEDKRCLLRNVKFPDMHENLKLNPKLDAGKISYVDGETIRGTCSKGYDLPEGNKILTCRNGVWTGSLVLCSDIDECAGSACGPKQTCKNLPGKYECDCPFGYTVSGKNCEDIDECAREGKVCGELQICTNTPGSYECNCPKGYEKDGLSCSDIDECTEKNEPCTANSNCVNTVGSYRCICQTGYKANDRTCDDVDECEDKKEPCTANSRCENTVGSYKCICSSGYKANGLICEDVDECKENKYKCTANSQCKNTEGSYNCECLTGFHTLDSKTCTDKDECKIKKEPCGRNTRCENSIGDYNCWCNSGYTVGDGKDCIDIDECNDSKYTCTANSKCVNKEGSFTCECLPGYHTLDSSGQIYNAVPETQRLVPVIP